MAYLSTPHDRATSCSRGSFFPWGSGARRASLQSVDVALELHRQSSGFVRRSKASRHASNLSRSITR
jgi:hypothetical protein